MKSQFFTHNSKTLLSVDFDRTNTCSQICNYCYVKNMERIYSSYLTKINRNYEIALLTPEVFADGLNSEYRKLRNSKSDKWKRLEKLPVRIYGSGDYIPSHYKFLSKLSFKFFIISKSLTSPLMEAQLLELLKLPNLTNIVLSIDSQNIKNYEHIKKYYKSDRISIAFTGSVEEFEIARQTIKCDTFFNIGRKKVDKIASKGLHESCPCDAGVIAHNASCATCNACWRSSITKQKDWNKIF